MKHIKQVQEYINVTSGCIKIIMRTVSADGLTISVEVTVKLGEDLALIFFFFL